MAAKPAKKSAPSKGKSVDEFRSLHDKAYIVPKKIEGAIAALGDDGWEYEMAFLKLAGLSVSDLAAYRDPFEDFTVQVGGRNTKRVWCGSKALAKKLREMV